MPQVQGVVESVIGHPGANGRTRFAISIAGQEYNTWKVPVANQAQALLGQPITANVTVKPSADGQFMNYYFDSIAGADAGQLPGQIPMEGAVAQPAVPMAQPQGVTQQIPVQQGIPMASPSSPGMDPKRESRIVKQSSMATAFNFIGHLFDGAGPEAQEEAEAAAMALAKRLYVQVLGGPQTLDDEIVDAAVTEHLMTGEPHQGDEPESW